VLLSLREMKTNYTVVDNVVYYVNNFDLQSRNLVSDTKNLLLEELHAPHLAVYAPLESGKC